MSKKRDADFFLPLSRIKTIMKSSLNTGQISNEVLFLAAKSAEMFVQYLSKGAYGEVGDGNTLRYKHLSQHTQREKNLEFLLQIVPLKVRVVDFKRMLELEEANSSSESEDDKRFRYN